MYNFCDGNSILNWYVCNFHAAGAVGCVLLRTKMNLGHSGFGLAVAVGQQSGFIRFVCSAGLTKNKLEVQQLRCHAHSAMLNISLSFLHWEFCFRLWSSWTNSSTNSALLLQQGLLWGRCIGLQ